MTDIEKKTREYAKSEDGVGKYDYLGTEYEAYLDGVEDGVKFALCNQWRDAEKEKPECGKAVLIGYFGNHHEDYFDIAYRDEYGTWYSEISEHGYPIDCPTAWLEIPEYKPKGE